MFKRVKILQPILDAAYKARADKAWPTHSGDNLDRAQFVSASEVGKCLRQIWFSKHFPLSAGKLDYWGYAERGHSHEAWICEQLRNFDHDYHWTYIGDEQVSFHDAHQSGTPDGLLQTPTELLVVDFKSIDPRTRLTNLPKPDHLDQVIQNMDLVEVCLDVVVDGALLAYSDASDYSKVTEFLVDRTSPQVGERMAELEDRAHSVMTATSAEDLPAEGIYTGGCTNCPAAYQAECSGAVQQKNLERKNHDKAQRRSAAIFG